MVFGERQHLGITRDDQNVIDARRLVQDGQQIIEEMMDEIGADFGGEEMFQAALAFMQRLDRNDGPSGHGMPEIIPEAREKGANLSAMPMTLAIRIEIGAAIWATCPIQFLKT